MSDAVRKAISDTIVSELATAQPDVLVAFENVKFTQPDDRTPWIMVAFAPGDGKRAELGNSAPVFFHYGVVNISVMAASDDGTARLHQIADSLFKILADRQWSLPGDAGSVTTYCVHRRNRGFLNNSYVFSVQAEYRQAQPLVR